MKKKILFLAMFTLALILAGTINSFGQSYKTNDPDGWSAPTCGATDDPYFPAIGEPYNYTVQIENVAGYTGTGTYSWKVVGGPTIANLPDLLTAGDVNGATTYYTLNSGGGTAQVNITWEGPATGNIFYVVMEYNESTTDAVSGNTCDINNVKVFPVAPFNSFWLDINANINGTLNNIAATSLPQFDVCVPDVESAKIVVDGDITTAEVEYDFGTTILYAEIHSEGYTGNFDAVLQIAGLEDNQTIVSITSTTGTWVADAVDGLGNGTYKLSLPTTLDGTDEVVQIQIANHQHESLADQRITISVDGSYVDNGITVDDMTDVGGDCSTEAAFADGINTTVTPRPTVTPVAPTGTFPTNTPALR